jgi:SAM-dependent methyltransferase
MSSPSPVESVEAVNDRLARDHDIDAYYADSSLPIRLIERKRLRIIRELVNARASDRILEVGCGGGHVLAQFPEAELTGVDVSGIMLEKARQNLRGYRVTLHKGELSTLDLAPHSFDAVVCTEVLEHVVDPKSVLDGIQRMVKPGGRVVITFPNDHLIDGIKSGVRSMRLDRLPPLRRVDWGGDHFHLHKWTIPEMRLLLSGYFVVDAERFAPNRLMPIRCCFRCRPRS